MPDVCSVYIVDDDEAVLDAMGSLLSSQGFAVAVFSRAEDFYHAVPLEQAGVLVVEVRSPGFSGIELLQRLVARGCTRPRIAMSGSPDIPTVVQAMQFGAQTFLVKPVPHQELLLAVRAACKRDGEQRPKARVQREARVKLELLASDELKVLNEIAQGRGNAEISEILDLSLRTVQLRLSRIYKKLDLSSKAELIHLLLKVNWTSIDNL
jgi:FixJ family two-component response regulator